MNLPNLFTLSRLFAIPVLLVLLAWQFPAHDQVAAGVFLLASLTDTVDGKLARRQNKVTDLGKFLDPLADKLFVLAIFIQLVGEGRLPAWIVVVIFSREIVITVLRSFSATQGHVIAASSWGKIKTVAQIGAVALYILDGPYPVLKTPANVLVGVALVLTLWSGLDYLWRFRSVVIAARPALMGDEAAIEDLARRAAAVLGESGRSLVVAESCTGGLLGGALTGVPGSSAWFKGGVISYSNELKMKELGVPASIIESVGAVSPETASAMASGARQRLAADLALAVTGVAGPDGGSADKPVGLTYIGIADEKEVMVRRHLFPHDRDGNRKSAVREALALLIEFTGEAP